ncbi:MAG: 4-hydroxy-tetrahydrodipicolinate synthase [Firmicutes bacterium]|nr:4-hydroxy-tetrahydrodipicolinate synthase [Bacillota bacterium]
MHNVPIFRGVATALITPLTASGVDYEAFGRLIDWQIEEGINALVIAGTTGEGATLSDQEHRDVMKFAAERAAGRIPMIAGTGSNDVAYATDLSKYACEIGYDAVLLVSPYYNKTTQKGLIASFEAVADAIDKKVILYNVPSRTGINIEPATIAALAKHPNIAAVKEANGNISKIVETSMLTDGEDFCMYSGNDDQIVPILSMGGQGVISVLSNVAPKLALEICDRFFRGDAAGAAAVQKKALPLINALFCETNPIPVKAAMAALGWCENYVRLPLVCMDKDHEEHMLGLMKELGLL